MLATQFQNVKQRLENDDRAELIKLTDPVNDAIAKQRAHEESFYKVVNQIKANTSRDSSARQAADDFVETSVDAQTKRMESLQAIIQYLGDEISASEALTTVERSISAEQSVTDSIDTLETETKTTDVSIPPIPVIDGPDTLEVPLGTTRTATYTLTNLGGTAADTTTLSVETDAPVSLQRNTVTDLSPSDSQEFELKASPSSTGQQTITIEAATDSQSDTQTTTLVVAAKLDYVERASQQVETLIETVTSLGTSTTSDSTNQSQNQNSSQSQNQNQSQNQGQSQNQNQSQNQGQSQNQNQGQSQNQNQSQGGAVNGLLGKLRSVRRRLQQLRTRIENGQTNAVDQKLTATTQTLGAVINQTDGLRGNQLNAGDATLIIEDTKQIIETISTAKKAAIE